MCVSFQDFLDEVLYGYKKALAFELGVHSGKS